MCIISYWWSQARVASWRSPPSSISSPAILPREKSQDSVTRHDEAFAVRKRKSDETLRPVLMDDGSHPYFPGTPWNELELAGTIDVSHQPRPRRLKLRGFCKQISLLKS
ncbi:hypothetical protein PGTUg99_025608 [Puccinia graminis f. sp. tritici]|uniref:Uncharacterized protein n=1 Tax=Puccinia graminis f. sp. tritici TaxID=56615 RepID=A0A5B0LWJ0_PUCGR|nr:hypothetical protein PGTUg99_025608 [Puccinia graminis f. sp. tritici]